MTTPKEESYIREEERLKEESYIREEERLKQEQAPQYNDEFALWPIYPKVNFDKKREEEEAKAAEKSHRMKKTARLGVLADALNLVGDSIGHKRGANIRLSKPNATTAGAYRELERYDADKSRAIERINALDFAERRRNSEIELRERTRKAKEGIENQRYEYKKERDNEILDLNKEKFEFQKKNTLSPEQKHANDLEKLDRSSSNRLKQIQKSADVATQKAQAKQKTDFSYETNKFPKPLNQLQVVNLAAKYIEDLKKKHGGMLLDFHTNGDQVYQTASKIANGQVEAKDKIAIELMLSQLPEKYFQSLGANPVQASNQDILAQDPLMNVLKYAERGEITRKPEQDAIGVSKTQTQPTEQKVKFESPTPIDLDKDYRSFSNDGDRSEKLYTKLSSLVTGDPKKDFSKADQISSEIEQYYKSLEDGTWEDIESRAKARNTSPGALMLQLSRELIKGNIGIENLL